MELLKWFVLGGSLIVAAILAVVIFSGRNISRSRIFSLFLPGMSEAVRSHRRMASISIWFTITVVVSAEIIVQLMDRSILSGVFRGPLFWVHLVFAGSFFATLLAIRLQYDGLRYPRTHGQLAYLCAILYCGTLATSIWLIIDLPLLE